MALQAPSFWSVFKARMPCEHGHPCGAQLWGRNKSRAGTHRFPQLLDRFLYVLLISICPSGCHVRLECVAGHRPAQMTDTLTLGRLPACTTWTWTVIPPAITLRGANGGPTICSHGRRVGWLGGWWQGRHACWPYQLGLQVILLLMALSSPPDTDEAP